ncbi:MAG TPA: SDR family oxidoreductase [Thermoleophilaceae bacterium]|jgi:NAD(P)-dependent dehydrogenase (short-subunit alcohol dehydrogenase family)|nr:SDR family oxidoreductase [Thermoleophilaceae bacterium]
MDGKRGVVTGAASGLGREVARLFAREGASVVVADMNADGAEAVAAEITDAGGTAVAHATDVTKEDQIVAALERCESDWGGLDFVINNAGVQLEKALHETTNEEYDWIFDVNVRAVFWGCKHAVLKMRESGGGTIVNTASALSLVSDPFLPVYTGSKHAVLGLTRSVGVAYAADGIRCNCVCPGDMQTPMIEKYWEATGDPEKAREEMNAMYPAGRIGQPGEVAHAILFLASEEASYVNGSFMQVDGGLLSKVY